MEVGERNSANFFLMDSGHEWQNSMAELGGGTQSFVSDL